MLMLDISQTTSRGHAHSLPLFFQLPMLRRDTQIFKSSIIPLLSLVRCPFEVSYVFSEAMRTARLLPWT
jgi:hypothetical protein